METLGLDFDMFRGMGEDISIALGLLVPAWLIYEFDAGLFWERTDFRFFGTDMEGNLQNRTVKGFGYFFGVPTISFVGLAIAGIAKEWYSDRANAFVLVLSGLSLLSFLHQVYLWREFKVCESAKEDFAKKCQESQMFFFLFFYTIAYLSGGKTDELS